MTYGIKSTLNPLAGDKIVATALDGVVYTENNRVHIKGNTRHYIYKYDGSPVGWYAAWGELLQPATVETADEFTDSEE